MRKLNLGYQTKWKQRPSLSDKLSGDFKDGKYMALLSYSTYFIEFRLGHN